jgi:peptidyl-prolyl cis-trans isomerase A (cyclophilin A)
MSHRFASLAAAAFALALSLPAHAANPKVELDTSAGKIRLELYPDAAPKTVENFIGYVKSGQYDGTVFHRVIDGFMIQGGGFTTDFKQKPTKPPIQNEAEKSSKAGLLNTPGTIAMARTGDPHSATAQFFINVNDNRALNYPSRDGWGYAVFGKVVDGMDVVNKIAKVAKGGGKQPPPGTPLDPRDVPTEPVVINKAAVIEAK